MGRRRGLERFIGYLTCSLERGSAEAGLGAGAGTGAGGGGFSCAVATGRGCTGAGIGAEFDAGLDGAFDDGVAAGAEADGMTVAGGGGTSAVSVRAVAVSMADNEEATAGGASGAA